MRDINWWLNGHTEISETDKRLVWGLFWQKLTAHVQYLTPRKHRTRQEGKFFQRQQKWAWFCASGPPKYFLPTEQSSSSYIFHHLCSKSLGVVYKGRQGLLHLWCLLNMLVKQLFNLHIPFHRRHISIDSSLSWHSVPMFWKAYYKPVSLRDFLPRIMKDFC